MNKTDKVEATKVTLDTTSITDLATQLAALQAELVELRKEKKALSDAEKKAVEEAREEMITDDDIGTLYIDSQFKEDGFTYRIVDSTRRGRVEKLKKLGYEIVEDSTQIGADTVSKTHNLGSAVTVPLGGDRHDRLGVLMRIPTDKYNKRQVAKVKRNREQTGSLMQDLVNKSSFGSIEYGSDSYTK